jgi:hypothetical protein
MRFGRKVGSTPIFDTNAGSRVPLRNVRTTYQLAVKTAPQVLVSSIKGEVKKKHFSVGWSFSCFPAPVNEREF